MKQTRFRFVALLGLLALSPFLAGAAGQTSAGAAADAPMEISFLMEIRSGEESTWFLDQVEERFNVRIVPNGVYHGDTEKVSLLLATGECPDLFCPIDPFDGLAQGLTRTIPVEMLHEHAPQYTKLLNDFYPIGWLLGRSPDDPTEYVALHHVGENADTLLTFATFRSDWAENVGFTVPNLDQAWQIDPLGRVFYLDEDFTLDQFEGLLKAFRDQDPDGNGKNDTIPWGLQQQRRLDLGTADGRLRRSPCAGLGTAAGRRQFAGRRRALFLGRSLPATRTSCCTPTSGGTRAAGQRVRQPAARQVLGEGGPGHHRRRHVERLVRRRAE